MSPKNGEISVNLLNLNGCLNTLLPDSVVYNIMTKLECHPLNSVSRRENLKSSDRNKLNKIIQINYDERI